jgi:hypothetical protein
MYVCEIERGREGKVRGVREGRKGGGHAVVEGSMRGDAVARDT